MWQPHRSDERAVPGSPFANAGLIIDTLIVELALVPQPTVTTHASTPSSAQIETRVRCMVPLLRRDGLILTGICDLAHLLAHRMPPLTIHHRAMNLITAAEADTFQENNWHPETFTLAIGTTIRHRLRD
jgi:hypothetical protein